MRVGTATAGNVAMLRDTRERHKNTAHQQSTMDSAAPPGASPSVAQPNTPSCYELRVTARTNAYTSADRNEVDANNRRRPRQKSRDRGPRVRPPPSPPNPPSGGTPSPRGVVVSGSVWPLHLFFFFVESDVSENVLAGCGVAEPRAGPALGVHVMPS